MLDDPWPTMNRTFLLHKRDLSADANSHRNRKYDQLAVVEARHVQQTEAVLRGREIRSPGRSSRHADPRRPVNRLIHPAHGAVPLPA